MEPPRFPNLRQGFMRIDSSWERDLQAGSGRRKLKQERLGGRRAQFFLSFENHFLQKI